MRSILTSFLKDRVFFSKLFTLAVPIIIQSFIMSSLNLVDIVMIGQIGDVAVAAVGLANQIYFLLRLLLFGICSGAAVFAAQYWGRKDISSVRQVLGLSVVLAVSGGLIFTIIALVLPRWVLHLYSDDFLVIDQGTIYLRVVGISYIATAVSFAYSAVLRSVERVKLPMIVSMIALVVNIFLNYGLILGKLGMPQLGIRGAAIGTTIARSLEFILLILFTYRLKTPAAAHLREMIGYPPGFLSTYFKTASPVIFNEMLWSLGTTFYYVIYARIDTTALAAANIASTIQSMGFVFFIGIATGCAILVGHQIGADQQERAYQYAWKSMGVNLLFGIGIGITLVLAAPTILTWYRVSHETVFLATRMIQMQGFSFWLKSISMILIVGILRSGGDTRYSMVLDVGCIWLVGLPLGAFAAFVLHVPAYWVTLIFVSEDVVKSLIGLRRFASRKWINNLTSSPPVLEFAEG